MNCPEDESSSEESSSDNADEFDLETAAAGVMGTLIPTKSNSKYQSCYEDFLKWRSMKKINVFTEQVFLVYFDEISKMYKPSTLWSRWSMLKSVMDINHNINLTSYTKLKTLVKKMSKGFRPKKSKVLTASQITQFLITASDEIYLAMKVVLIFGISGAMRSGEFCPLTINDIEDTGKRLITTIRDTKNCYPRSFVIENDYYEKTSRRKMHTPSNWKEPIPRIEIAETEQKKTPQERTPMEVMRSNVASNHIPENCPKRPSYEKCDETMTQSQLKKKKYQMKKPEPNAENIEPMTDDDIEIFPKSCRILKLRNCKITNLTVNYNIYKNN